MDQQTDLQIEDSDTDLNATSFDWETLSFLDELDLEKDDQILSSGTNTSHSESPMNKSDEQLKASMDLPTSIESDNSPANSQMGNICLDLQGLGSTSTGTGGAELAKPNSGSRRKQQVIPREDDIEVEVIELEGPAASQSQTILTRAQKRKATIELQVNNKRLKKELQTCKEDLETEKQQTKLLLLNNSQLVAANNRLVDANAHLVSIISSGNQRVVENN